MYRLTERSGSDLLSDPVLSSNAEIGSHLRSVKGREGARGERWRGWEGRLVKEVSFAR